MTDLRPMWEKICRDLGINPGLVRVYFLEKFEWKWDPDYSWVGWGGAAARFPADDGLPEVAMVPPYSEGKNGYYLDMMELRDTCYHELIHVLLRNGIVEEEVTKMADILNRHQDGWRYWRSYLRGRAMALGLAPVPPEQMRLPF